MKIRSDRLKNVHCQQARSKREDERRVETSMIHLPLQHDCHIHPFDHLVHVHDRPANEVRTVGKQYMSHRTSNTSSRPPRS